MPNGCRWDDGLVGAAMEIATVDHSPLRVLAGPGTGKTFALMRRVARLLQEGANPNRMLVCTFTRTAASDLRSELSRLGIPGIDRVIAGTIHAFCFRLLSQDDVLRLTHRNPRQLLKLEERFLLEDMQGDNFGGIRARDVRLHAFNAAWARLQSDQPGWPTDPVDRRFQTDLIGWLRFHEAMLVGELVSETLRYLRENPASSARSVFDHVLVDEYQDLNRAEQVLLDLLAGSGTLSVIGDEDQSIYAFKHAHPEGISTFDSTHAGTHDIDLDECRRCPRSVITIANTLIENNLHRASRSLSPLAENPEGEVHVLQWSSIDEEAHGIAEFIRQRVLSGSVATGRVLVLAPRRQFGYAIRDALNSIGVLAHSFFHEEALDGNPKRLDECVAQQAFTLLALLADTEDRVALRCWCGFGSNSLRSGAWSRLRQHCEGLGESPRMALERLTSGDLTLSHTSDLVSRFRELQRMLAELSGLTGENLVDALFPISEEWARPFRSLASRIGGTDYTANTLREALRVGITQPELPTDVDYVRVMSLHKSKGLTADLVVVVGCIEGLIPFVDGDTDPERNRSLEEQRRLFYVAITRTRNVLVLSSVTQLPRDLAHRMGVYVRRGNPTHASTIASQFLSELGPSRPAAVLGTSVIGGYGI